jgi:hypothetical protein
MTWTTMNAMQTAIFWLVAVYWTLALMLAGYVLLSRGHDTD